MEQLLLVLFILFSIVSSLLERRKRKAQLAEAQAKQRQQRGAEPAAAEPALEAEPEEEDAWGGWPLPGAGDPFEAAKPKPARRRVAEPQFETESGDPVELTSPASAEMQASLERLEREARQAEARAKREEDRARREEGRARREESRARDLRGRETPAMRSVQRLMEKGLQPVTTRGGRQRGACGYALTSRSARRAVVWAEIIGPCKAEGQQEDRW